MTRARRVLFCQIYPSSDSVRLSASHGDCASSWSLEQAVHSTPLAAPPASAPVVLSVAFQSVLSCSCISYVPEPPRIQFTSAEDSLLPFKIQAKTLGNKPSTTIPRRKPRLLRCRSSSYRLLYFSSVFPSAIFSSADEHYRLLQRLGFPTSRIGL